jgi:hypothetical protein
MATAIQLRRFAAHLREPDPSMSADQHDIIVTGIVVGLLPLATSATRNLATLAIA